MNSNAPNGNGPLALKSNDQLGLLPIGPHDHPDPHTMVWSDSELRAIRLYAAQCLAAERERSAVDDGQGDRMDALLLRAKDIIIASRPDASCHGGYTVPTAEWLALQAEVMHRLREHAREGVAMLQRPVTVPAWKLRRAAEILDRDGDEHGVAADLWSMLADAGRAEHARRPCGAICAGKIRDGMECSPGRCAAGKPPNVRS